MDNELYRSSDRYDIPIKMTYHDYGKDELSGHSGLTMMTMGPIQTARTVRRVEGVPKKAHENAQGEGVSSKDVDALKYRINEGWE